MQFYFSDIYKWLAEQHSLSLSLSVSLSLSPLPSLPPSLPPSLILSHSFSAPTMDPMRISLQRSIWRGPSPNVGKHSTSLWQTPAKMRDVPPSSQPSDHLKTTIFFICQLYTILGLIKFESYSGKTLSFNPLSTLGSFTLFTWGLGTYVQDMFLFSQITINFP